MRKLMQSLSRRLLPAAQLEIMLPSGIRVPIGSRDQISRFEEVFLVKSYTELLDQIPIPATVCDLGCNAGYFPLAIEEYKKMKGVTIPTRYVCVDANAACLKIAQRSLEKNLPAENWRVVRGCVGNPGEEMRFHVSKADAHSSVIAKYSFARTVKMKALDLQALFQESFPDGIDLLKVDVEGAESYLVNSWGPTLSRFCRWIMFEYHPFCGLTAREFTDRLGELGFVPASFLPDVNGEQIGLFSRAVKTPAVV
jgi:FkbM family methyltransferase